MERLRDGENMSDKERLRNIDIQKTKGTTRKREREREGGIKRGVWRQRDGEEMHSKHTQMELLDQKHARCCR